ncbi:MAG: LPS export ABC transporter periplasmic protein LptC [Candidatus Eremiobacteraeota bacterium]|nr:LPS export ABC transporter periplasmic protein LptC [Candidatus Eremiobacteraeota bacterium]MBC5826878.1 LPS export ABC transporter periplasmic protein LptC [Candidatus Eremiobacteraeota bacterium]
MKRSGWRTVGAWAAAAVLSGGGADAAPGAGQPTSFAGTASQKIGDLTVNFGEFDGNFKSGDFTIPGAVTGHSSDGDFRADRASGNLRRDEITMIGHVVVHRLGGVGGSGQPQEPVTLTCQQLRIATKAKLYTASGAVKVVQGSKSLTAPFMRLDDTTHQSELTGGVHAEQPPDRTFDAASVLYNTRSQDFKALGNVQATFPIAKPSP